MFLLNVRSATSGTEIRRCFHAFTVSAETASSRSAYGTEISIVQNVTAMPPFQTEMLKTFRMRSPSTTGSRCCNSGRGLTVLTMEYSAIRAQEARLKHFVTTAGSIFVMSALESFSTLITGSCRSRSYHAHQTIFHVIKC